MADYMAENEEELDVIVAREEKAQPAIDISDDDSIINLTQQRRLAFIEAIAPDGGKPKNFKDNRIYLDALLHTSDTAQKRITAKQNTSAADKDRDIVQALVKEMRTVRGEQTRIVHEDAAIPVPTRARFAPNRAVTNDVMDCAVSTETHSEFMKRTEGLEIIPEDPKV